LDRRPMSFTTRAVICCPSSCRPRPMRGWLKSVSSIRGQRRRNDRPSVQAHDPKSGLSARKRRAREGKAEIFPKSWSYISQNLPCIWAALCAARAFGWAGSGKSLKINISLSRYSAWSSRRSTVCCAQCGHAKSANSTIACPKKRASWPQSSAKKRRSRRN
jgi:hypothetical protein